MLNGRKVFVTGSHSGIGFAIAQAVMAHGGAVVIHARDPADLAVAIEKLGADAYGVVGDLADQDAPARLIGEAAAALGGLDGLVNNAALLARSTLEDLSAAHLDAMFAVNVRAPLLCIQAAAPVFERAPNGGSVVNIGSINAYCGAPNLLAYSASKAALMTATRNLGDALGERAVRINQINVGWTLTESERKIQIAEGRPADWLDVLPKEFAPRGALLAPEEVAEHAAFWLSDRSAPATGQVYELEQYPLIGRNRISTR